MKMIFAVLALGIGLVLPAIARADEVNIAIKNEFLLVKCSVYVNGEYECDVPPGGTISLTVEQGASLRCLPDLAPPGGCQVIGPGVYRVFPFLFDTKVEYVGY